MHGHTLIRFSMGCLLGIAALVVAGCSDNNSFPVVPADPDPVATARPNILFVVLDDVGMDQMEIFGFGGATAPATPTIGELASSGVSFSDTWAMPACSVTRAAMFEGRFPLRTNVKAALGPNDLANSMTSPYAMTIPRLLAGQGYESALIGKFHIALQGNYPAGDALVHDLGWDYFAGWLDETGDPTSIDTTAGGIAPPGTYSCGFVPGSELANGADAGACYMADGSCSEHGGDVVAPGRSCRDAGGLFNPNTSCQSVVPERLDFTRMNAHSVSPVTYNRADGSVEKLPTTDPRSRQFRASFAVDAAADWINSRAADQAWMATVSFASIHTPLVPPPVDPASPASIAATNLDCSNLLAQRELSNLMVESLDLEIGRLLVEIGLATHDQQGSLVYAPESTDTMVVVLGDNGSLGYTVKLPFDLTRSKGSAYQTGVWVPLIVSGPLVDTPDRQVRSMVNAVDLFALFAEIAGVGDVQAAVPRMLDAVSMLPYLTNPDQPALRDWNYTEVGLSLQADGEVNGPCVINSCTQIPNVRSICEDNNGVWWGKDNTAAVNGVPAPGQGFKYCSEVLDFVTRNGGDAFEILPLVSIAVRNDAFKLVENTFKDCSSGSCVDSTQLELFEIDQPLDTPWLDRKGDELPLNALSSGQQTAYVELQDQLALLRASVVECPGDGNIDGVVDEEDLRQWERYASGAGLSSVYDLNLDGRTDALDEVIIQSNLGLDCRAGGG
ncbi:sulfatase-like hydrolase/transferase [Chromatocurvus halotolerans]|uniref:Sulfatase-like protein n=1 Tax=Chromatocurvus halotolerans TaxID=1132028 RepID=A0A4R2L010_9GAMM|nr:sulfatase-like hydrolase/transferase [Chromatocurvus halotolerans]TCO75868.1 sulfatase-like protein [Chromatocurvus halotolerans]